MVALGCQFLPDLVSEWLTVGGRNHKVEESGVKGRDPCHRGRRSDRWPCASWGGTSTPWT